MAVIKSYKLFKRGIVEAPHYFAVLGAHAESTAVELAKQHRALAMLAHPDHNGDPQAHDLMSRINVAYETLTDPKRRKLYEATLGGHKCSACKGSGTVRRQQGFKAVIKVACPTCKGSGHA